MLAARLRHRITIQTPATGQDAYGEPLTTWADVATVWAEITDASGREYFAAQAAQNPVQTKVKIRYLAGIAPAMRVAYGSTHYNIEAVLDQTGRRKELVLMCSRGVSNG